MAGRTIPFKVQRLDDGDNIDLLKVYRRPEDQLADVASPDGRSVFTPDEVHFYFSDEPDRPMQIVEDDE